MRRLNEIRSEMLEKEILTPAQANLIKGGGADAAEDEKRRPRPGGGGSSTHSGTCPTM
ncbi:MAG: hypothetical protein JNL70_09140 [Saprospiraceae bacterium]|nr:hypothetical protein [Saprospiraceae bacterium]